MSSAGDNSDCNTERMAARDEHYKETTEWPARSHKKVNSEELCEVGAQFHLSLVRGSSPRADYIDIDIEEPVPCRNTVENLAALALITRERRPNGNPSQDATKNTSSNTLPLSHHHISKEDVAILIAHRDRVRDRATCNCAWFHSSIFIAVPISIFD